MKSPGILSQKVCGNPVIGLQESSVAEGGGLVNAHPITRKVARACGCASEDHRFHLESCSPSVTLAKEKKKKRINDDGIIYVAESHSH